MAVYRPKYNDLKTGSSSPPEAAIMTDSQLSDFAKEHLYYEALMLNHARSKIGAGDWYAKMAATETFLLHYRNLYYFFCPPPRGTKPDDVIAVCYAPDWRADQIPDQIAGALDAFVRDVANKQLCHISTNRTQKVPWSPAEASSNLRVPVKRFLDIASPEKFHSLATSAFRQI